MLRAFYKTSANMGFTLIELLMIIMLLSVITTVTISEVSETTSESKYDETLSEMIDIRNAIVGNPDASVRGIRNQFGYVGDVGSLPSALTDLLILPTGHTTWTTDTTHRLNHGWNGPYLQSNTTGQDFTKDAWGNDYVYSVAGSPPTLVSLGADGAAGGVGLDQDITIALPQSLYLGTVHGFLVNGGIGNPDDTSATIDIYHPNGTGGVTFSQTTINIGAQGHFAISNIPLGVRSAIITIGADTIGPIQFTVDKNQFTIPTNFTDTSILTASCNSQVVQFRESSSNDSESAGIVNIVIEMSATCASDVSIDYSMSPGTATAGADYTSATGTIIIPTGTTSVNLPVSILNDGASESSETFFITISNPSPAGITLGANTSHTFTINDDESPIIPPIINLGVTDIAPFQIDLGWTQSVAAPPVSDFQVEYKLSADSIWNVFVDGVSVSTTATVTGLSANSSYDFRVKAYNGAWGAYSNVATGSTTPNDTFFDPNLKTAFNLGGATESSVVAMESGVVITLTNATYPAGTTLTTLANAGDTYVFTSALNDILSSDKEFFVAGRKGSGSAVNKGNMVWSTSSWAGKEFYFTGTRDNPHVVTVHAFTDSTINISSGGSNLFTQFVAENSNQTFSISSNGGFELISSGLIIAYVYSNNSGRVVDPHPILPSSPGILGFPSKSAKISTTITGNPYTAYFSDSSTSTGTLTLGNIKNIPGVGTSGAYKEEAIRVIADHPIVGNSYADGDGNCAATYVPTSMLKYRFAINVNADWVAMASVGPGTIDMISPSGTVTTLNLVKTGSESLAPYKVRVQNVGAGYRFFSTNVRFQAWYEPKTDTGGSNQDETIMFGYD
ncbi:MAG: type II secretion system protein GspG [Bdellovibrionales bacterium]|nr:type II secretion system protein GspG [Bdellovibrionales bacterium]